MSRRIQSDGRWRLLVGVSSRRTRLHHHQQLAMRFFFFCNLLVRVTYCLRRLHRVVFLYYVAAPRISSAAPIRSAARRASSAGGARRVELQKTGATWMATTDYRTYAMLRWFLRDRIPVIEVIERGRFQGFADPGMDRIKGHAGLYVAREPDQLLSLWDLHERQTRAAGAGRARLARDCDGYLCPGEADGLDARAVAAAGHAVLSLARAGARFTFTSGANVVAERVS